MKEVINRLCEVLEECMNDYKENKLKYDNLNYIEGVLTGKWEIADSIKNQLFMQGIVDKKLDKLIDEVI